MNPKAALAGSFPITAKSPNINKRPYPVPEDTVKKITEKAGCITMLPKF
jgi:hypothetical protein